MKITPTAIPDEPIIEPKVFGDARGAVFDVVVDIRKSSPTSGKRLTPLAFVA